MRMAGATFTQIADRLGYSDPATCRRAIQRALDRDLDRSSDLREEYRRLQLARTERLLRRWWLPAVSVDPDVDSDRATSHVVKLLERQARLLGLDAPQQISVTPGQTDRITSMVGVLREMSVGDLARRDQDEAAALDGLAALQPDGAAPEDDTRFRPQSG